MTMPTHPCCVIKEEKTLWTWFQCGTWGKISPLWGQCVTQRGTERHLASKKRGGGAQVHPSFKPLRLAGACWQRHGPFPGQPFLKPVMSARGLAHESWDWCWNCPQPGECACVRATASPISPPQLAEQTAPWLSARPRSIILNWV